MNGEHDTPGDEELGAWLDGEMDKGGAADMAEIVARDDRVAMRVQRIKRLDDLVRRAVPEEEIPDELLHRLGLSEPAASARIVSLDAARQARTRQSGMTRPVAGRMPLMRIAAQVTLVVGVGSAAILWQSQMKPGEVDANYRALSDAARPAPSNGVVIFTAGTDAGTAQAIARSAGARLVGPPNEAGAWKLVAPTGRRDAILAALRKNERVTLAEAIDGQQP